MDDFENLSGLLSAVIDARFYNVMSAEAEKLGDKTFGKLIEAINVVAKRHNMTFKELFDITMDLSILINTEE